MISNLGKAIAAAAYAVAFVALPLWTGDRSIDPGEAAQIVVAVSTAAGTYLVPLYPGVGWVKTAVGVTGVGANAVIGYLLDGMIDSNEVLMGVALVLGALGIWVAPASSTIPVVHVGSNAGDFRVGVVDSRRDIVTRVGLGTDRPRSAVADAAQSV